MDARVGDHVVIESAHVGQPRRRGEVVEVLGTAAVRFRIRWEDGHESILSPSSDAHVEPAGTG
jgi:hypothetical protein